MKTCGKIIEYANKITTISLTICPNCIYQINAMSLNFYSMVRYADYLIYIFIDIYGNIRNLRTLWEKLRGYTYKITHISAAYFPSVAHLVSY